MSVALDIMVICAILIAVLIGVNRGFVKTAVRFIGMIVSMFLASVLGGMAAEYIFNSFFRNSLLERINASMGSLTGLESIAGALESFPDFILRTLASTGITTQSLYDKISNSQGIAATVIVDTISPVFIGFIKVLAIIVIFMILMIIVRALSNFFDGVSRLPVVGTINGVLGGVLGLLTGIMVVWIVIAVVSVFTPMFSVDMQKVINEGFNSSYLAKAFTDVNPIRGWF